MKLVFKTFITLIFLVLVGVKAFSQGNRCATTEPFCSGDEELVFPNSNFQNSSESSGEIGPYYGCLESQPYPSWFFLQVEESGNLEFTIEQRAGENNTGAYFDVDFVVWGPFDEGEQYCNNSSLNAQNLVDCSYEPDPVEVMDIPNARANEIYVVLITNYSERKGFISLQQTNSNLDNAGSTDCSILNSTLGGDKEICGENFTILDGTTEGADSYAWFYKNETDENFSRIAGETNSTLKVSRDGFYRVLVTDNETESSDEDEVEVRFFDTPLVSAPGDLYRCDPEENTINLNLQNEKILSANTNGENYLVDYFLTEEDMADNKNISNPRSFQFEEDLQVFARVEGKESGCVSTPVAFHLKSITFPEIPLQDTTNVCLNADGNLLEPVYLGKELAGNFTYEWFAGEVLLSSNSILNISEIPENKNIRLHLSTSENGCVRSFSTFLATYAAPEEVRISTEGNNFNEGFTVGAEAIPGANTEIETYEYRLDNGNWQQDDLFRDVSPGLHQVFAREIHGCEEVSSEEFRLIGFPKFFTPNEDGYHDFWTIQRIPNVEVLEIHIFDRYGKFLKEINLSGPGWNGSFNSKPMPASDYWFKMIYKDQITGKKEVFKSHFSLKR